MMLADMEAKKAVLEQAIASLKAAIAAGALGRPGEVPPGLFSAGSPSTEPVELPVGAFLNKSVPAAVKLYLSAVKKKQKAHRIAAALKEGGMESTAANFETVVVGALHRLKTAGEVLRFKDGWGLTEHYPDHIRRAILQEKKPVRKKTKKVAKSKAKKESGEKAQIVPIIQGLEQRITTVLKTGAEKSFAPAEIAKTLEVNVKGVVLALGRMAAKGRAEKFGNGYRTPIEAQKAV
jgi:hypothetical protein